MAKPPRYSQLQLLEHIIELCDTIHQELGGRPFEDFERDRNLVDATAYRLQAIGEACTKLGDKIKAKHELPWAEIIGMRHILSHDYLAISRRIVWRTATSSLGELRDACDASAREERGRAR